MESPTLHPEPGTAHLYTFESCSGLGALTVAAEGVIGRCSDHGTPAHLLPAPGGESFELLFNPGASAFYLDLKRGLAEPGNPVWGYARTTPEKRQAWVLYVWVAGVGKGDLLPFSVAMAGASPHLGGAAALVSPSHAAALARLSSAQGHWCLLFQSAVEGSLVLAVAEDGNALCVSEYDEGGVPTPHQLWRAERVSDTEGLPAAVPSARTLERYLERHAATDSITHKDNCDIRSFSIENDYRLLKLYSDAATSASAPLGLSELPLPDGMPLIVDLNVTAQLEEGGEVPSQRLWAPSSGSSLKQVYDLCRALRSAYAQVLDIPDKRPMHFTVLLRNNGYLDGHEWRDGIHIQCKELWAPAWIHRFVRERFHRDCAASGTALAERLQVGSSVAVEWSALPLEAAEPRGPSKSPWFLLGSAKMDALPYRVCAHLRVGYKGEPSENLEGMPICLPDIVDLSLRVSPSHTYPVQRSSELDNFEVVAEAEGGGGARGGTRSVNCEVGAAQFRILLRHARGLAAPNSFAAELNAQMPPPSALSLSNSHTLGAFAYPGVKVPDFGPLISGSLSAWRSENPFALAANVSGRKDLRDADFVHLEGIIALDMSRCSKITDAAFSHLHGILHLNMHACIQPGITDAAFSHLSGITTLDMHGCNQQTISDKAFSSLRGIRSLNMSSCCQNTITDSAFAPLAGITSLNMSDCRQPTITDAAFASLVGIQSLDMSGCRQPTITDAAFVHLRGILHLKMSNCIQTSITSAAFSSLADLASLDITNVPIGQTFASAQYYMSVPVVKGMDLLGAAISIKSWFSSLERPLTFEAKPAKPDRFLLKIFQEASSLPLSMPLSQALNELLSESLSSAFSALGSPQRELAGEASPRRALSASKVTDARLARNKQEASHYLAWFIETFGEGRLCQDLLAPLFAKPPVPLRLLADAKDKEGRIIREAAKASCRELFDKYLLFCGRYELLPDDPRVHASSTCRVLFFQDRSHTESGHFPTMALKFMRHEAQFKREVDMRRTSSFSHEHVMALVRTHTPTSDPNIAAGLSALGSDLLGPDFLDFCYVVVLPAGGKTVSTIIDSESQKADWADKTHFITRALARSLAHMHELKVIHGDVKPRNLVRADGQYLLIDLDATVPIGAPVSEKTSTAFAPPELLAHLRRPADAAHPPLAAHPSFDMWSLGVTLYLMLQKQHLFSTTTTDTLARSEADGALLAEWSPAAHAEAVAGIKDRAARALVYDLLHHDPTQRPSAAQVLEHPYITCQGNTARLGGEAPAYDVFISYREASEGVPDKGGSGLVQSLYDALTARKLRVFADFKELEYGKNWKEGFCAGAAASLVFLPLLSSEAFGTKAPIPWSKLTEASFPSPLPVDSVDNVLLEHRLAVELQHRGYMTHIFPVFVGPCMLDAPAACVVESIEKALEQQLKLAGLSLPFTAPQKVAEIWRLMSKERKGVFLKPFQDLAPQLAHVADLVDACVKAGRRDLAIQPASPAASAASSASDSTTGSGSPPPLPSPAPFTAATPATAPPLSTPTCCALQ